jgi:hypothetical protein
MIGAMYVRFTQGTDQNAPGYTPGKQIEGAQRQARQCEREQAMADCKRQWLSQARLPA